jgi:transposase
MKRFIEGVDRSQSTMFPERLEDWIGEDNAVRVVDVFVDELDLCGLGFGRVQPLSTGRPSYHPTVLLNSISTATSTGFSRAAASSAKPGVTWKSCG